MRRYFVPMGNPETASLRVDATRRDVVRQFVPVDGGVLVYEWEVGVDVSEEFARAYRSMAAREAYVNLREAHGGTRTGASRREIEEWRAAWEDRFRREEGRDPSDEEARRAVEDRFPARWVGSLDALLEACGADGEGDGGASRVLAGRLACDPWRDGGGAWRERLEELVASWSPLWRDVYERHVRGGESFARIARERGVTRAAVRATWTRIVRAVGGDAELRRLWEEGE